VTNATTIHAPSKARYGSLMACVCVLALAASAAAANALGADSHTLTMALAAIAIGSLPTFFPLLFTRQTGRETNFGLVVFFASGARLLLIVATALLFSQMSDLAGRPFWIGVMTGAGLILIIESTAAIWILSKIERSKASPTR